MAKSDKRVEKHVTCKSMIQSYDTTTNTMKAGVDAKITEINFVMRQQILSINI